MVKFIPYLILGSLCLATGFLLGRPLGQSEGKNKFREELESQNHKLVMERSNVSNLFNLVNNQLNSNPTNPVVLNFDFRYYCADSEIRYRFDLKQ